MSTHSLFSPSAAHRWMACPGSMAFPENREQGESSVYADDGSATHAFAAAALDGEHFPIGHITKINGKEYTLDEERAQRIQGYCDDVRRRATGGHLFVESKVDLSNYLGAGQSGTADVAIALPVQRLGIIEDLKDGSGEKVYASYCVKPATADTAEIREPNPQLALYALGMLPNFELFGEIDNVLLVIYQPKLDHIDEFLISKFDLELFGDRAAQAMMEASDAMMTDNESLWRLNPGKSQCRWCRAKTKCPALKKFVAEETSMDFEVMEPPVVPMHYEDLANAYVAVPLIEIWCADVKAEMQRRVAAGEKIRGPDGQHYKFVEGKPGARKWIDEAAALDALTGQLTADLCMTKPKVISAPQAAKLLDKKKTAALWNDIFVPLIKQPPGKPILTFGSDDRPAVSGAVLTDDYEDEISQ